MNYGEKSLKLHRRMRGKIEMRSKVSLTTRDDLSVAYTPGVGVVSSAIGNDKNLSWVLTNRANQVAVVSDGTAVLGLGDIGPEGAMPVMEGKAIIFKEFAGIDATPLCIDTKDVDEIVRFCKLIQPSFAGINLEDISAPRCFDILERLENELDIPVFHDDQDGTAIVVLAALLNACRVSGKTIKDLRIVVNGGGAAGFAVARLILTQKPKDLIMLDSKGIIYDGRSDMNVYKNKIAKITNKKKMQGDLSMAMNGADVFIGLSKGNLVSAEMVRSMNERPFVFAMANPTPEIMPDEAQRGGAFIVGTGRSDFPNQINNALVFPGIFRGLLDNKIKKVTEKMKIAAAYALADSIKRPRTDKILPDITEKKVVKIIARALIRKE